MMPCLLLMRVASAVGMVIAYGLGCESALAQAVVGGPGIPALSITTDPSGTQTWSVSLQILAAMTALTLIPAALLTMTAFTRIIIVLAILRQALGTAQTPSAQVLLGLALFMTFFVMGPVFDRINGEALQPWLAGKLEAPDAVARAAPALREFMLAQTRESDLALFSELSKTEPPADLAGIPFKILVPSFLTSELKTAFQIGFLIFIPFLIIDLVVASVLMSMGMMMLSPLIISAPFKLMLFVLVDGWALVVGTLAGSFQV